MKQSVQTVSIFAVLAMAFLMSSCTKELVDPSLFDKPVQYNLGPKQEIRCTAGAGSHADNHDKAFVELSNGFVKWHQGDTIRVNNSLFTIDSTAYNDQTFAYFHGTVSPLLINGHNAYFSIFPHNIIGSSADWSGSGGSLTPSITLPETQNYVDIHSTQRLPYNYMAAYTEVEPGTEFIHVDFKNLCCMVRVKLRTASGTKRVSKICLYTSNSTATGFHGNSGVLSFSNSNSTAVPTIQWSGTPENYQRKLTLNCANNANGYVEVGSSDYTEFILLVPMNLSGGITGGELCLEVYNEDCTKMMRKIKTSPNLQRSNIYTATFNNFDMDREGFIDGDFSISPTKVAKFSKGNLQWLPSNIARSKKEDSASLSHAVIDGTRPGIWRFAIHQYDFVGSSSNQGTVASTYSLYEWDSTGTTRITRTQRVVPESSWGGTETEYSVNTRTADSRRWSGIDWLDLFGFATSGYGVRPWRSSATNSHYHNNSSDICQTNYDWGYYNAISNGGNNPGMWRLFTQTEWKYILRDRTDALNKIGFAQITGAVKEWDGNTMTVNGCVLLPDHFVLPSGCSWTPITKKNDWTDDGNLTLDDPTAFTNNSYTVAQWRLMEQAGAVFIPASGYKEEHTVSAFNSKGYAFSSSKKDKDEDYYFYFGNSSARKISYRCNSSMADHYGRGVRVGMDW